MDGEGKRTSFNRIGGARPFRLFLTMPLGYLAAGRLAIPSAEVGPGLTC
jgi:hypothetical protein